MGDPIHGSVEPDTEDKDQRTKDSQQSEPKVQENG